MTEYQEKRVKEIKDEWLEEIKKIPPAEPSVNGFDDRLNKPYRELEKKYKEKIRQVMEEEEQP